MAVLTGLFASEVLLTLPKPTILWVIPDTVPVNVGEAKGAFRSNADCKPLVLEIDKAPSAIAVAFPTLVTGPVKFALVALAVVIAPVTNAVVATCVVFVPAVAVGAAGVPVNVGEAKGDFKSNAVWVAVLIGLFASEVLLTLPRPTMLCVIPDTVPVNVGEANGAFKSNAV